MEDTPATRQATKARIGPWYVLQSRNPAAPGMKYATLLALINKGHVTARSIVRGPTTHQLWRFAAHVRGVSREFGICYSCAGEIDRETSICPHCQRTQDAPAEPDALLEPRLGAVPPSPEATAPEVPSYAARMRELQRQRSVGEAEARSGADRAPVNLPTMQQRQRQDLARRSDGRVVSAMELAAALQDDPASTLRAPRRIFFRAVAALLLMAVAGAAVVWFFVPQYRQPAVAWMNRTWTDVRARVAAIDWPKVTTHGNPEKDDIPATVRAHDVAPPKPIAATPSTPAALPPVAMVTPEPQTAAAIEPPQEAPAPPPAPKPAPALVAAPPAVEAAPPVPADPAATLSKARQLWGDAIDAEAKHDFVGAAKLLEEIKRLPSDVWPGGLDIRLKFVQSRASQQSSAE
jgi:hypothetical protein